MPGVPGSKYTDWMPFAPRAVEDLERELKFVLPMARAELVRRWLDTICRPDPEYPDADVWTVYYDTPDWQSLEEKLASDYLKTKLRVRWYAVPGGAVEGRAFVEAKFRVGARRDKVRRMLDVPAPDLALRALDDPVFGQARRCLAQDGLVLGPAWQPALALRYRRRRYLESFSRSRVSLDTDIAAMRLNHARVLARCHGPLPTGVLEVKGEADTLPGRLRPLLSLGIRKQSFSKYSAVYLHARRLAV